jgi:hypothetical protein
VFIIEEKLGLIIKTRTTKDKKRDVDKGHRVSTSMSKSILS